MTLNDDKLPELPLVASLIKELNRLPGIGIKSAQRLAYFIIRLPSDEIQALADSIQGIKDNIVLCSVCYNFSEIDPCSICVDQRRDKTIVCVVEQPLDVLALERGRFYLGLYHVLHGVISPINGIGPGDLKIQQLIHRLEAKEIQEVIIAVNPTLEGDATGMYLQRLIGPLDIKVTHLARGLPVGADLGYADDVTLNQAFKGRREI